MKGPRRYSIETIAGIIQRAVYAALVSEELSESSERPDWKLFLSGWTNLATPSDGLTEQMIAETREQCLAQLKAALQDSLVKQTNQ